MRHVLFERGRGTFTTLGFLKADCQGFREEEKDAHDDGNHEKNEVYGQPRAVLVHENASNDWPNDTSRSRTKRKP